MPTTPAQTINFDEALAFLQSASAYELYRLSTYIRNEMESPQRLDIVKAKLRPGDKVEYYSGKQQALCKGTVYKKNIKYVVIQSDTDEKLWNVPYFAIKIDSRPIATDFNVNSGKLTKNNLKIGDTVGFHDNGIDKIGTIEKLNPKTVSLVINETHERWRVGYSLLFPIIEGESSAGHAYTVLPNTASND